MNQETWSYRDLDGLTKAVAIVAAVYALGVAAHIAFVAIEAPTTGGDGEIAWSLLPKSWIIELVQKAMFLASAALGLVWIYCANQNAHVISIGMKRSPTSAVAWFFVPALNILFGFSATYEIWVKSGGPEKSRLLLTWWAVTIVSIYTFFGALPARHTFADVQIIYAASAVLFAIVASRVNQFQQQTAIVTEFNDQPVPKPNAAPIPDHLAPPTYAKVETIVPTSAFTPPKNPLWASSAASSSASRPDPIIIRSATTSAEPKKD